MKLKITNVETDLDITITDRNMSVMAAMLSGFVAANVTKDEATMITIYDGSLTVHYATFKDCLDDLNENYI